MTVVGEIFVAVRAQAGGFEADLKKQVEPGAQRVAKTLATTIGSAFVLSKIKNFAQAGIAELKSAAAAQAQTAAVIKSTGGAANVTADEIGELAEAQMRLTGVDDELIQSGANKIATFTGVRNEVGKGNDIFNQATKASLDLSQAGFGSVESAAVLMGKALNDPVQGLTALQRVGVRLSDTQKDLVKELVATGDTLGAQKVILEEVNKQVGGSAEAYGKTLPGQLAIAQESMTNTKAVMVSSLAPALQLTAGAVTFLTDQFAKQPAILQQVEGGLLLTVGALGSIITPLKSGIDLWRSFGRGAEVAGAAADGVTGSSGRLTGRLKTTAVAVGVVGAAFVAAQVTAAAFGRDIDHVDVNKLTGQLIDLAAGTGDVADLGVDIDSLGRAVERIASPSNASRLGHFGGALFSALGDPAASKLNTSKAAIDDLDKALANLAGRDPKAAAAALEAIEAQMSPETVERLTPLLDDYGSALAGIDVGAKLAADGTEDLAGATGDLTVKQIASESASTRVRTALDLQRVAMDELLGTTNTALTADLDYRDAQDASADALTGLHQLMIDGKGGTDEYRRAVDDASRTMLAQTDAAVATAEAQAALSGTTLDASEKAIIQRDELVRLAETLSPKSPLRAQLEGFLGTLDQVTPKHVTVTAETKAARLEIQKVIDKMVSLDAATSGNKLIFGAGSITARDHAISGSTGGLVPAHLAAGGLGFPGSPRGTDVIPAWLSQGEFVMQRSAVDRLGVATLAAMNRGTAPAGAGGQGFTVGQLVVQGATTEGAYATATETVRQLRAEHYRLTGVT